MSTNRDFDRITSGWLAEGPTELADRVLDAALDEVHLTNQRRRSPAPWRIDTMSMPIRLAAGIAVIAVLGVAGIALLNRGPAIGNSPGPTPSASPIASPSEGAPATQTPRPSPTPIDPTAWTPFTSARHGYSARYPGDWALTPATAPATLADLTGAVAAVFDHFKTSGAPADEFLGVSTKLPSGMSEADWIAAYRQPVVDTYGASCFPPPDQWKPVTVDGHIGGLYVGCNYVEATTFVDGRAYIFTLGRPLGFPATAATEDLLRAFLSTVTVDPAAADDTPVTP
jgi:hypothetical protein